LACLTRLDLNLFELFRFKLEIDKGGKHVNAAIVCYNFEDPNSHNNTLPFSIITGDGVGEDYDVIERAWGPRIKELLACDGNSDFKIDLVDVGLDPVTLPTYDFSPCCACGGEAVGGFTLDFARRSSTRPARRSG
jgi:hypothetical protein